MDRRRLLLLLSVAGTASSAWLHTWGGELVPHRAKTLPGCLDGIPDRDYQYRPRSSSVVSTSRRAYLLAMSVADTQEFLTQEAQLRAKAEAAAAARNPGASTSSGMAPRNVAQPEELPRPRMEPIEPEGESLPARDSGGGTPRLLDDDSSESGEELDSRSLLLEGPRVGQTLKRSLSKIRRTYHHEYAPGGGASLPRLPDPIQERARQEVISKPLVTRIYQLDRPTLAIDQCEISQIALQLRSDGRWVLSLRADQNRRPDDPENAPYNPKLYVKRNEFNVRLRCLGGFSIPVTTTSQSAGQPVMAAFQPEPFWVENGQPRYLRLVGCERNLWLDLEKIDRVEVEFFYR